MPAVEIDMSITSATEPVESPRAERGAAVVEFALVLPLLFMLVFGIIHFGRGYNAKIELTGAVREGARELALGRSATQAQATVMDAAPTLSPITFSSVTTCPSGATTGTASITAHYDLDFDIPLVDSGTWTITVTGVMRCGV
jgi:Flp pilus assembly protein TadG